MTPQQIAPLARQMMKGLAAAHAAGIVHRDLKPDNVFILKEKAGQPDYVKIIDFGISKFQPLSGSEGMRMTSTGAVMGTPYYMSPEQASGSRDVDARSDLYTCGVILYECATGRVPFDGETFNQLMFKIVLSEPPPIMTVVPDLDPAFASIIQKAMGRDVTQRFQTAAEFGEAIKKWEESGAAVAVPVNVGEAAVPGVTRAPMASVTGVNMGATAAGGPPVNATGGNWASSQGGVTAAGAPAKSNNALVVGIAAGVLLAAGVIGAMIFMRGGSNNGAAAAPASAPAVPVAAAPAAAPPAPSPAVAPAPPPAAAPAPAEPAAAPAAAAPAAAAPATKTATAAKASTATAAKARPAAAPVVKKKGAATSDDFGY